MIDQVGWSAPRILRFGFLMGLGWTAKQISSDPTVRGNPNHLYQLAFRWGLSFRDTLPPIEIPEPAVRNLDEAAKRRGIDRFELFKRFLAVIAEDPIQIDNVLDDLPRDNHGRIRCRATSS